MLNISNLVQENKENVYDLIYLSIMPGSFCNDPNLSLKNRTSFIPHRIKQSGYCYCGIGKHEAESECLFCSLALFKTIDVTA